MTKTKTKLFNFLADPAHAWLSVSAGDLADLNLTPSDFSRYSYQNKEATRFYLEEDCDAPIFLNAFLKTHNTHPQIKESYSERSFVRHLPRISTCTRSTNSNSSPR